MEAKDYFFRLSYQQYQKGKTEERAKWELEVMRSVLELLEREEITVGDRVLIYLTKKNKRKKDIEISEPDNTLSINIETVIACIMLVLFTIYHAHLVNMVP